MTHDVLIPYLSICMLFVVKKRESHLGKSRELLDFTLLFLCYKS